MKNYKINNYLRKKKHNLELNQPTNQTINQTNTQSELVKY